eukprot:CAMPEP_0197650974 /NCGR_PEP_ID=MMETSP1338-20131121/31274_1 /TAXON_ID=43686 ORGANISM="Pelagodinium beii, Strain RCC1491" /NCGR_SAMPLE_ID=MMETSP1338 /ASSEMBLY_ACC=CAM_ASM_000754 /LENGTH=261 /DNA_ID=CAMNT_0043225499 /DNA_START=71 /DNA_END=853 /DNA_ORIENTATION=-
MELSLLSNANIPEDSILSIRAGSVRRQAALNSGRPFRFPSISPEENPLKIDILQQVGTAYLVLKPGEEQYKVVFSGSSGMNCEVEVKKTDGEPSPTSPSGEKKEASQTAKDAKEYLDAHQVLPLVQAVLQTVIKEKPADPCAHMARHFMSGYSLNDVKTPVAAKTPEAPPAPAEEPKAEAPAPEAPKAEAPAPEEPKAEEAPPPAAEEPKADAPAPEAPKAEAPAEEAPAPAPEEPKAEEAPAPAAEEPKTEEAPAPAAEE